MKERNYLLSYLIALVVGILLVVFAHQADLFNWIVIVIGIGFMVPSLVAGITYLVTRAKKERVGEGVSAVAALTSVGGLIFGILLVCMPQFFAAYMVYTFGILLIICGLAQIIFVTSLTATLRISKWYLLVPVLTLAGGIVVLILGPNTISHIVSLLTGIILICFAINGFVGSISERRKRGALQAPAEEKHEETL